MPSVAELNEKIEDIACEMREGEWQKGKIKEYAERWGVGAATVSKYAAEAWRRVCHEADNPEKMRPEIAGILRYNLHRAHNNGNYRAVCQLADVYTKVIGARAPDRHEHSVVVAQFDSMTKDGKLKWIEERLAKLQESKKALLDTVDMVALHE